MTTKTFIEKAIEGGYDVPKASSVMISPVRRFGLVTAEKMMHAYILLDPLAWQAVGKVEGWDNLGANGPDKGRKMHYGNKCFCDTPELFFMHRMIDALAAGQSIEQYLETL